MQICITIASIGIGKNICKNNIQTVSYSIMIIENEVIRKQMILGNVTCQKQHNFSSFSLITLIAFFNNMSRCLKIYVAL